MNAALTLLDAFVVVVVASPSVVVFDIYQKEISYDRPKITSKFIIFDCHRMATAVVALVSVAVSADVSFIVNFHMIFAVSFVYLLLLLQSLLLVYLCRN